MSTSSLFPLFMRALGSGGAAGADNTVISLASEPDITLDDDVTIVVDQASITVEVTPDITIEVE